MREQAAEASSGAVEPLLERLLGLRETLRRSCESSVDEFPAPGLDR